MPQHPIHTGVRVWEEDPFCPICPCCSWFLSVVYRMFVQGEIHWPRELSKGCYDAFQPKWMQLFGDQLPKLYESFEKILREEMRGFHEHMAQKLPQIPNLEDIQASVEIEGYLQRVRISSEQEEQMTKRELCEEVTRNVQFNLKSTFEDAKDIKGKGSFERMKEHIDGSAQGSVSAHASNP